ncbi:hypothetical protein [Tateyamaria sp. syn59]|uniref:hypothetical protein n=1 Tax=Tateyamaria sp. syn59 TaxID=2576942 RepID=UPI0011BE7D95|nr:hypothetical protein [Tateyamaria sp. syn59]
MSRIKLARGVPLRRRKTKGMGDLLGNIFYSLGETSHQHRREQGAATRGPHRLVPVGGKFDDLITSDDNGCGGAGKA